MTVVAILLAALGREIVRARQQWVAVNGVHQAGTSVVYFDMQPDKRFRQMSMAQSTGWRRLTGETFLSEVNGVNMEGVGDVQLMTLEPHLAKLPDLWSVVIRTHKVSGNGLKPFLKLPHLRTLHCYGALVEPDDFFTRLSECTHLEELTVSPATFTPGDAQCLARLKRLKYLSLPGAGISEDALETLAKLPNLKFLELSGAQITDVGVEHLQTMQQLTSLDLNGTLVTDNSVPLLGKLSALKLLGIQRSQISEAGADELRRLLPTTRIVWKVPTKFDTRGRPLDGD